MRGDLRVGRRYNVQPVASDDGRLESKHLPPPRVVIVDTEAVRHAVFFGFESEEGTKTRSEIRLVHNQRLPAQHDGGSRHRLSAIWISSKIKSAWPKLTAPAPGAFEIVRLRKTAVQHVNESRHIEEQCIQPVCG